MRLKFYFHDVLEQLKTNFHTNFRFERGVNKTRGQDQGRGLYIFLKNTVLFEVGVKVRSGIRVSVNPNPKTAYFKEKLDPDRAFYSHPFKRVLGFVIKYAWISTLLRDAASWYDGQDRESCLLSL